MTPVMVGKGDVVRSVSLSTQSTDTMRNLQKSSPCGVYVLPVQLMAYGKARLCGAVHQ